MKRISEILDEMLREVFEERAAIREFDAGMPRDEAEKQAMEDVEKVKAERKSA